MTTDDRSLVITGIGELVTNDPAHGGPLGVLHDAAVVVADRHVAWVGPASQAPSADDRLDADGRCVLPGFVDSHSHAVFAGDRSAEFTARMAGTPYTGGGIATTVAATRAASDGELRRRARCLVEEMLGQGTTTVEIKSGYGQDVATEVRTLRIARELTEETTFLGAHTVPAEYAHDRRAYLDLVTGPMLAACAPHARWVDVFCEPAAPTAFDADEAREVLQAGRRAGLLVRVHGNQLGHGPGVRLAVEHGAASVDHCTYLSDDDVAALAASGTVATLLPAVEFSTRSPYPDARRLLDAGVTVALATDCNPGTCGSSSMPLVVALAVRELRMTPEQALWSATAGGAAALRRADVGSLRVGARADLVVLDAPTFVHLAYRPGVPLVHTVLREGRPTGGLRRPAGQPSRPR
ncbi:imidazolonepropionase [Isoptericola halotolerans]|uniref:Imidazolonepropionase n=1 Tax=Isoptericola halotolerans TaxID=300560 RepID=A0ABX2A1W8_9MICO|nr:imidazolonepropionase [Isoptericola halotolerans]NOV95928.1 imidazolonepropionase [Isoptericola halotolerans]